MTPRRECYIVWIAFILVFLLASRDIIFAPRDITTFTFKTHTGHSWEYNIWRIMALGYSFAEGHSGKWIHGFYFGWGYPLFQYTGALPYAFGALLFLLGFNVHVAVNLMWLIAFFASGACMLWVMQRIFGRWGALLAAVCYLLAPYHLVDIFVRTNLGEFSCFVFPPLILSALWVGRESPARAIPVGAIGVACLAHSHMLSTILIGSGFVVFSFFWILLLRGGARLKTFAAAIGAATLGLALAASFWLPAVFDIDLVQGDKVLTTGYSYYGSHFVYPFQLVSWFWSYGESTFGFDDGMSFTLGFDMVVLSASAFLLAFLLAVWSIVSAKKRSDNGSPEPQQHEILLLLICSGAAALAMIFMTLQMSEPVWKLLPQLAIVQFPWRFLFPAAFFLSICVGAFPVLVSFLFPRLRRFEWLSSLLLSALILFYHWDFCRANTYEAISPEHLLIDNIKREGVSTTNAGEFLPVAATAEPNSPPPRIAEMWSTVASAGDRVVGATIENGWARVELAPGAAGTLSLNQFWYPAWKAFVDGKEAAVFPFPNHPYAPIAVSVPENAAVVEFSYEFTRAGYAGIILSCFAAGIFVACVLWNYRKARQHETAILSSKRELFYSWCLLPLGVFTATLGAHYQGMKTSSTLSPLDVKVREITKHVPLAALGIRKTGGTIWDMPGNVIIPPEGLAIDLDGSAAKPTYEISLDANDRYRLVFTKDGAICAHEDIVADNNHFGLQVLYRKVPDEARQRGFNRLFVLPREGDGNYSIGHLLFTGN